MRERGPTNLLFSHFLHPFHQYVSRKTSVRATVPLRRPQEHQLAELRAEVAVETAGLVASLRGQTPLRQSAAMVDQQRGHLVRLSGLHQAHHRQREGVRFANHASLKVIELAVTLRQRKMDGERGEWIEGRGGGLGEGRWRVGEGLPPPPAARGREAREPRLAEGHRTRRDAAPEEDGR